MTPLAERPILITGANGGIGSALVADLLAHGFKKLACQYRERRDRLDGLGLSSKTTCFQATLTDVLSVGKLADVVVERVGAPWAVINLAGCSKNAMSWKMDSRDFRDVIDGNLLTTFLVSRELAAVMRTFGGGRIINASSVVASSGAIGAAAYCAAKAGIEGLTRAMALELANKGVTVNALALGYFGMGMIDQVSPEMQEAVKARTPVGRFGRIEEVAGLVRFLLSDEGAFTTGQVHHVNGGYRL